MNLKKTIIHTINELKNKAKKIKPAICNMKKALLILLVACNAAFAVEPRQVLVGPPTATYYNQFGNKIGSSILKNNVIEVYGPTGALEGKITKQNPMQFYKQGTPSGKAKVNGNEITIYDRNGALEGRIQKNRFYLHGSVDGWATEGNQTTFYDKNGKKIGWKF